jgi:glycogen operon protein
LRKRHAALREDRWLSGRPVEAGGFPDVEWRRPDGHSMEGSDWMNPDGQALVAIIRTSTTEANSGGGDGIAFNAGNDPVAVQWPNARDGFAWHRCVDTTSPTGRSDFEDAGAIDATTVAPRSVVVVTEEPEASPRRRSSRVAPEILDQLAAAAGISGDWWDVSGKRHIVGADTKRALLAAMGLRADSTSDAHAHLASMGKSHGQHSAPALGAQDSSGDARIPAPPNRCFLPAVLRAGARRFGLAAHLYSLRRKGDQGIGDFTTLAAIAAATARAGGSIVGVNPLHALFPGDRERASPYHPSDRRFLDPIYIDLDRVPDLAASDGHVRYSGSGQRVAALAASAAVDTRVGN